MNYNPYSYLGDLPVSALFDLQDQLSPNSPMRSSLTATLAVRQERDFRRVRDIIEPKKLSSAEPPDVNPSIYRGTQQ